MHIGQLHTEAASPASDDLDTRTVSEVLTLLNDADQTVPAAVARALPEIQTAVQLIAAALTRGGRLIYLGAGTSGRLGLLDAVECPPTFGTDPGMVVALLAGGTGAFEQAVEGAEDDRFAVVDDLDRIQLGERDVVVGLSASGRTPYVVSGLDHARSIGAKTISLACNPGAAISAHADVAIEVDTGPEVLTGSTRLKAGTAQKLVCNMLTTVSMIQIGKVYRNLMVDVRPTNAKLVDRARRIVMAATDADVDAVDGALEASGNSPKVAIVMLVAGVSASRAHEALAANGDSTRAALEECGATA